MPRNGSGSYSLPEAAFVPGTTISSASVNDDFSDIATALTQSVAADGQTPLTGPLKQNSGTLGNPTWTFNSDTATGMYLSAAGKLGLVADGFGVAVSTVGFAASSAVAAVGGTSYVIGDTITLTGGSAIRNAVLQVASLSGSAVASVTVSDAGLYAVTPANPAAQGSTSGSGSGATFTVTYVAADLISSLSDTALWAYLGATSYMAGAMANLNGLALANYIGAANIAAAVSTSLPLPQPEGYLTPVSGTPIILTDSIAATRIYYTPYTGSWTALHNGTNLVPYQFSEMSLTLSSAQQAGNIYDIFIAYNSNVPVIGTGPSWAASGGSVTAGSCARGTGANSTALTRSNGIYVNAVSLQLVYNTGAGNVTITVDANQGVYLGSIYVDATFGQVTCHRSYGQNRKWGVWNVYNQAPLYLKAGDGTASWGPSGTLRAENGAPATYTASFWNVGSGTAVNGLVVLCGLAVCPIDLALVQRGSISTTSATQPDMSNGIGLNSITAFTGKIGTIGAGNASGFTNRADGDMKAEYQLAPSLGLNNVTALEQVVAGGSTQSLFGTETYMILSAKWLG